MAPTSCAVCDKAGTLAPYRDIARAYGLPHPYAHLDCVRYSVASVPMREIEPGLYEYVIGACEDLP